jgi:hypothetical protein
MGSTLREAQEGCKPDRGRTLRLMYTVKIDDDIYVSDFS